MLGGATAGVAASPFTGPSHVPGGALPAALALLLAAALGLAASRPDRGRASALLWLGLITLLTVVAGLICGQERLRAIDAGAFQGGEHGRANVRGFVTAVPDRSGGDVSIRVETADGRLLVEAPEPVPDLPVGSEIRTSGTIRKPASWQAGYLRMFGIETTLAATDVRLTGRRRGGVGALTDSIRDRAEAALDRGMPAREAALARGFVLGQDDRIDAEIVDDFKRSGLAHLLAVSGQNVILLALLAMPLLAALNLSLRARLVCVLALIVLYVPVTGAGPSIQRAGVMGAAGVIAALAGRPRSRWYAILLAAFATLAVNPRASADIGWQLSFAAVIGILLWTARIRDLLLRRLGGVTESGPLSWQRALAEGAAMTVAATVMTAPLMAHHFESISLAALPANLLALPAVAPVMWLGMLVAMAGQVPLIPVEPLNAINALLIAYIAEVAHWTAGPDWALVDIGLPATAVAGTYLVLVYAGWILGALGARRAGLGLRPGGAPPAAIVLPAAMFALLGIGSPGGERAQTPAGDSTGLEITVLDVGQGDAILLEPPDGDPVLVDAGPPGSELEERLADEGVDRLGAVAVTHDELDHAGGVEEVLGAVPIGSLVYSVAGRELLGDARAAEAKPMRVAEGEAIRSGRLRLDVLWPPRSLLGRRPPEADGDPNALSLVLLARWHRFSMLLTGDAEAESAPIEPGPVDVLKVAHHGSEDTGLERLLDRTIPRLAVISVGEDNPYGHPAPETMATLRAHDVRVLRTDRAGDVEIEVGDAGWWAEPE